MTEQAEHLAFPWAGETPRPRIELSWLDFLTAVASVQNRYDAMMRTERTAEDAANAD